MTLALPGPTGERNSLTFVPRGVIFCVAHHPDALLNQLAAVLATGSVPRMLAQTSALLPNDLPHEVRALIQWSDFVDAGTFDFQIALIESAAVNEWRASLAAGHGALISIIDTTIDGMIPLWRLVSEHALCVNTSAAGGNASLMAL